MLLLNTSITSVSQIIWGVNSSELHLLHIAEKMELNFKEHFSLETMVNGFGSSIQTIFQVNNGFSFINWLLWTGLET